MLRRKPTALTISPEDLSAFEEAHARKVAYAKYRKTGEDPHGWFGHAQTPDREQARRAAEVKKAAGMVDPNDELKPLPGDKARIVRSREERIVGMGGGPGAAR